MIYTVPFNPASEYVVQRDRPLEIGGVHRASAEHCVLGGKGINVSGVLTELGCGNVALGFVAGETGAWLERGLAARGQRTDFIRLDSGMTRINVKLKGAEETELNGAGPQITPEAMEQLYQKLDTDSPLEIGGVNRASAEHCVLGGKGINVSGVLTELGCGNVALGFVAGETGAWLERGLAARGQRTDFIRLDSGMTLINVKIKGAEETELNGAGPQITPEAMEQLYRKLDALLPGDVLVLAGSIPACLPQDTYQQILTRLKGKGVRTAVDATGQLMMNVLPYRPFLIKPNHHELAELLGRELYGDQEIAGAARVLQQKGARNVLVSMAGDGALLLDEEGWVHRIGTPQGRVVNSVGAGALLLDEEGWVHRIGTPQGRVVNSVGAGDSMLAGFMAGYLDRGCYDHALRLGTACGSATAFCLGLAQRPQIEQMLTQLEKAAFRTAKDAD